MGAEHDFWVYDPRGAGWTVYGKGRMSPDGARIEPDAGAGLQEYMGFGIGFPVGPLPPPTRPTPEQPCGEDGDPVDCATGLFMHRRADVAMADDMPVAIERTYRPGDTVVHAFGKGTNHTYGVYVRSPTGSNDALELVLPDGGGIELHKISGTKHPHGLCLGAYRHLEPFLRREDDRFQ